MSFSFAAFDAFRFSVFFNEIHNFIYRFEKLIENDKIDIGQPSFSCGMDLVE